VSKGYTVAPWRIIDGTGQSLTVPNGSTVTSSAVGAETRAIHLALQPTATATGCLVRLTQAGTAATASKDFLIKTTDPPLVLACSPGDKVSAYGLAACTLQMCELTN